MKELTKEEVQRYLDYEGHSVEHLMDILRQSVPTGTNGKATATIGLGRMNKDFEVDFNSVTEGNIQSVSIFRVRELTTDESLDFHWREDREFRIAYIRMVQMIR